MQTAAIKIYITTNEESSEMQKGHQEADNKMKLPSQFTYALDSITEKKNKNKKTHIHTEGIEEEKKRRQTKCK